MRFVISILLLCALPPFVGAQTSSGPVLGWTLAADGQEVYTVFGVPGASRLGPARRIPAGLGHVSVNPASPVAAVCAEGSGTAALLNLETLDQTELEQARPGPDLLAWSPAGTALGLLYRDQRWAQIFVSDSGAFRLKQELSLAADQIAVSDSGLALLALKGNELSLYTPNGSGIVARNDTSGFTFLAGSELPAYWSEGNLTAGGVTLQFSRAASEQVLLASPARGNLIAIRSASGLVTTLNTAGEATGEAACDCAVSSLEGFGRPGVMRLGVRADGPLWAASAEEPRIFFIPQPERPRHRVNGKGIQ